MADNDDFEDENDEGGAPRDLRKQLDKSHKENKALQDRLDQLEQKDRKRTVSDYLSSKGLNAKVANLLPTSITDPAEIETWLTEYADVFGPAKVEDEPSSEPQDDGISDETKAAHQRVVDATAGGEPTGAPQDLMARIQGFDPDGDPKALAALLSGAS